MISPQALANALATDPEAHNALYDLAYALRAIEIEPVNKDDIEKLENLCWETFTDRIAYLITKNRRQVLLEQDRPVTSEMIPEDML